MIISYDIKDCSAWRIKKWMAEYAESCLFRRDIICPCSADPFPWESILSRSGGLPWERGYKESGVQVMASDLDDVMRFKRQIPVSFRAKSIIIAVDLALDAWTERHNEDRYWPDHACVPESLEEKGVFLGYDVLDEWMTSGLFNCGIRVTAPDAQVAEYASMLNEYHLFRDLEEARHFAEYAEICVPEHAPFLPFGIWVVGDMDSLMAKLVCEDSCGDDKYLRNCVNLYLDTMEAETDCMRGAQSSLPVCANPKSGGWAEQHREGLALDEERFMSRSYPDPIAWLPSLMTQILAWTDQCPDEGYGRTESPSLREEFLPFLHDRGVSQSCSALQKYLGQLYAPEQVQAIFRSILMLKVLITGCLYILERAPEGASDATDIVAGFLIANHDHFALIKDVLSNNGWVTQTPPDVLVANSSLYDQLEDAQLQLIMLMPWEDGPVSDGDDVERLIKIREEIARQNFESLRVLNSFCAMITEAAQKVCPDQDQNGGHR